ncbi:hypothetical protein [Streptomyces sp. NBC_01216]|uniref:hypothetical protein n=1 Tax=Streptomyces sp. NBC_01216 TaxID=2903778 RepID=UPI002E152BA5
MTTDSHHPASRITDALLPAPLPPAGAPRVPASATPALQTPAAPGLVRPRAADVRESAPAGAGTTEPRPDAGPGADGSRPRTRPLTGGEQSPPPRPGQPAPVPPRPAAPPAAAPPPVAPAPADETTTRLRRVRAADATSPHGRAYPRPTPAAPPGGAFGARPEQAYGTYGAYRPYAAPPESPGETTTRLRPVRERRTGRTVAAGACLVLGLGLVGGAVAGAVLAATDAVRPEEPAGFAEARTLWHSVPVDTLFPRSLPGPGAGPGGAARTWTRVVVAPDAPCSTAVLSASLLTALRPVGCDRVVRATYTDATATSVITVGLVFTQADPAAMRTLGPGLGADVPPALSGADTVAARFGDGQRASWWTHPLPDLPVVVYSVSGFADGRRVPTPQPADQAMADEQTTAPAEAGLGHEAKGVADGVEGGLRAAVAAAAGGNTR